jgi:hypothetical protein
MHGGHANNNAPPASDRRVPIRFRCGEHYFAKPTARTNRCFGTRKSTHAFPNVSALLPGLFQSVLQSRQDSAEF